MRPYTCTQCKRELIHNGMRGPLPKLCARCVSTRKRLVRALEEIPAAPGGMFMAYERKPWHAVVYGGRRR